MKNLMQFETAEQMRETIKPWTRFTVYYAESSYHTDESRRAMIEEDGTVFVFGKGKRRYGRRYGDSEFIKMFACKLSTQSEADEATKWERRVKNVIKKLEASGLWENLKTDFEKMLEGGYENRHENCGSIGWDACDCITKSMYFGKFWNPIKKQTIKECMEKKESVRFSTRVNYDVSFEYDAERNRAWYSEEYRNCGNGHYYLAIDGNTALFYEND